MRNTIKCLSALALAAALAACGGGEPDNPHAVRGKSYTDAQAPVTVEFAKDKGTLINHATDEKVKFEYSQIDDQVTIVVKDDDGKERVHELQSDGRTLRGSWFDLRPPSESDKDRFAQAREESKERRKQAKADERLTIKGAPHDASRYVSIDEIGDDFTEWSTWLLIAHGAPDALDDEKLLDVFSREWASTDDAFARNDIKQSELARIKARLEDLRKTEYIALPAGDAALAGNTTVLTPYDFEQKGFVLSGLNACATDVVFNNRNGLSWRYDPKRGHDLCFVKVEDAELARGMEALRSENALVTDPVIYAKVGVSRDNTLSLIPVGAKHVMHKRNWNGYGPDDVLMTADVWPEK